MKVALISLHTFSRPGGVKRHVLDLAKEFKRRGIKVKIIVPRRKRGENYGKGVILLGTSLPINFIGGKSDFDVNFNPLAIEKVLRKEKFDILHFHNFAFPSSLQILERSEVLNVLTFHSNVKGSKFLKTFPFLIYLLNKILQWKMHGIIGVAPLSLRAFRNYSGPKTVIPNGIDLEVFNPKVPKIEKYRDGKINILFVGRIEKRKGLIYLLRAYRILEKKFSNLRLIVIGDGILREDCQKYVKDNNLKEVYFEGEKNGRELSSFYATCDIFCSPAIFGESFGLILLEAMACQKPVVAFANQGYKELLAGKKGEEFLARPRDSKALAKKIGILVKNEKLRKEMGEWGIKEAMNYSWNKVTDRILEFYQLCLENRENGEKSRALDKIFNKLYNRFIRKWPELNLRKK